MSQEDLATISDSNEDHKNSQTGPLCPVCGSKLTRRSMRRSLKDRFKSAFGLWPYRCQMCNTRFTGSQDPESIARHKVDIEEEMRFPEDEMPSSEEAKQKEHPKRSGAAHS